MDPLEKTAFDRAVRKYEKFHDQWTAEYKHSKRTLCVMGSVNNSEFISDFNSEISATLRMIGSDVFEESPKPEQKFGYVHVPHRTLMCRHAHNPLSELGSCIRTIIIVPEPPPEPDSHYIKEFAAWLTAISSGKFTLSGVLYLLPHSSTWKTKSYSRSLDICTSLCGRGDLDHVAISLHPKDSLTPADQRRSKGPTLSMEERKKTRIAGHVQLPELLGRGARLLWYGETVHFCSLNICRDRGVQANRMLAALGMVMKKPDQPSFPRRERWNIENYCRFYNRVSGNSTTKMLDRDSTTETSSLNDFINQLITEKEDLIREKNISQSAIPDLVRNLAVVLESTRRRDLEQLSPSEEQISEATDHLRHLKQNWSGKGCDANFQRGEQIPVEEKRGLGHGANGTVTEVTCKGVQLALKKIRRHRPVQVRDVNEINVLKRLEHRHIVKLIGTYTQPGLIGLLIWPVAQCDLALLLDFLDSQNHDRQSAGEQRGVAEKMTELNLDADKLNAIAGGLNLNLWNSFGCLIGAIEYLHRQNVRHKDIKPSNILFSKDGVWLTDFGSSKDFSADLTSTSESIERGTLRYSAPEVSNYQESGRSADIFSLGCVFLEMMVVLVGTHSLSDLSKLRPVKNGSYEANLELKHKWLDLAHFGPLVSEKLLCEIDQMLDQDRIRRPTAELISFRLARVEARQTDPDLVIFYGKCCLPIQHKRAAIYKQREAILQADLRHYRETCSRLLEEYQIRAHS